MKEVIIYTDGACRGNPGLGGWGVLMQYHNENKELYGGEKSTANIKMVILQVLLGDGEVYRCYFSMFLDDDDLEKGTNCEKTN